MSDDARADTFQASVSARAPENSFSLRALFVTITVLCVSYAIFATPPVQQSRIVHVLALVTPALAWAMANILRLARITRPWVAYAVGTAFAMAAVSASVVRDADSASPTLITLVAFWVPQVIWASYFDACEVPDDRRPAPSPPGPPG